ncbi:translation initiation factor IF-3 [Spiroplasma endosymbiont of Amphibalanus improvisus]|uniref:translation initiation factor IF-3 n=1 Tax=Spiroplasma endosymbiont of Amphibalanus improvisus TaxID=3066327 RepID=UPI00313EB072
MAPIKQKRVKEQVNEFIFANELLVIMPDGSRQGPISKTEALRLAEEKGLDLLVINPNQKPPVAKILDYGKFKYESKKKTKDLKKKQHIILNKEMRLRTGIGDHDMETKAKKVREFLEDGNKVKISLNFRGREAAKPEFGVQTLNRFFAKIQDIAVIEKPPKQNGRFLDMYIVPKKK